MIKQCIKERLFCCLPRIFHTYKDVTNNGVGVCTLLCHSDVNFFIWNLTSFFYFSKIILPVYIVDDGTLTKRDCQKLNNHFHVLIEPSQSSEKKIFEKIRKYPYLDKFRFDRKAWPLRKKFDALLLNPFSKFIYMDADILFLQKPTEIIGWIERKTGDSLYSGHLPYPSDCFGYLHEIAAHSYRLLLFHIFKLPIHPAFNSGLLCIANKSKLQLDKLDEMFQFFYKNAYAHHKLAEEAALAFAVSPSHFKLLPAEKYVNVWAHEEYHQSVTQKTISVHYSANVKYGLFKSDALKLARRNKFFKS